MPPTFAEEHWSVSGADLQNNHTVIVNLLGHAQVVTSTLEKQGLLASLQVRCVRLMMLRY